jgi:membrane protein DedA with SNARE-associated domain
MSWWKFLLWNAAGGIVWAAGIALLAYEAGKAVADAIERYGLYAVVVLLIVGIVAFFVMRRLRAHLLEET